jgi:hypothetical protein
MGQGGRRGLSGGDASGRRPTTTGAESHKPCRVPANTTAWPRDSPIGRLRGVLALRWRHDGRTPATCPTWPSSTSRPASSSSRRLLRPSRAPRGLPTRQSMGCGGGTCCRTWPHSGRAPRQSAGDEHADLRGRSQGRARRRRARSRERRTARAGAASSCSPSRFIELYGTTGPSDAPPSQLAPGSSTFMPNIALVSSLR